MAESSPYSRPCLHEHKRRSTSCFTPSTVLLPQLKTCRKKKEKKHTIPPLPPRKFKNTNETEIQILLLYFKYMCTYGRIYCRICSTLASFRLIRRCRSFRQGGRCLGVNPNGPESTGGICNKCHGRTNGY